MLALTKLLHRLTPVPATRPPADRDGAERLVANWRDATGPRPDLEGHALEALRQNVLVGDAIDADATAWLRRVLLGGPVGPTERRFLTELHTRARRVCPEFQRLLDECVRG